MSLRLLPFGVLFLAAGTVLAQPISVPEAIKNESLGHPKSYDLLTELTKKIGARLSGSPGAAKAVEWGQRKMRELGFENVRLVPCKVPHWVRGKAEKATLIANGRREKLTLCALGGSVATPKGGVE